MLLPLALVLMHFMHVLYHGIATLWVTRLFKWADANCLSMHGNGAVLRYHPSIFMMPARQRRAVPRGGSLTVSKVA